MRKILSLPRLALFGTAATALFAAVILLLPPVAVMPVMDGIFMGMVGTVTVVFFPMVSRALRDKEFDRVSQLTMGILLTWVSLVGTKAANYLAATGDDRGLVIAFLAYMAILGGILHVTAPGMVDKEWKYHKRLLLGGLIAGIAISAIAVSGSMLGIMPRFY